MVEEGARIERAERALLDLADFIYAHTPLKPMSKTLFFLSRVLVTAALDPAHLDSADLTSAYQRVRIQLRSAAPLDDFDFPTVVGECGEHLPRVLSAVRSVLELSAGTDKLGLAFNTLLRGKWEGGEGLGTYLTPEEVVEPMVQMLIDAVGGAGARLGPEGLLFGDICGGSGRFVHALARALLRDGAPPDDVERAARLFDQSSLAVGFASVNFALEDMYPAFARVPDSLLADDVSQLAGRFLLLATNPPFGSGKYAYSEPLRAALPEGMVDVLGLHAPGASADPSELFLCRNLQLLAPGGALAIVLPDGVVQSPRFPRALEHLEGWLGSELGVLAAVSLPPATFTLGGTVAKTSFLLIRREATPVSTPIYVASASHVGFLKRSNRRVADPGGNDLPAIVEDWRAAAPARGARVGPWRDHERLVVRQLLHGDAGLEADARTPLRELADRVRALAPRAASPGQLHISVLDIDPTGLIDVIAARRNRPVTPGITCASGDVLVSCINPAIWRVAVVPSLEGVEWACSAELLVLRPRPGRDPWALGLALHHGSVIAAVRSLAGGTSSSRQRVDKQRVLDVAVPIDLEGADAVREHAAFREQWYRMRMREGPAYDHLHSGGEDFELP